MSTRGCVAIKKGNGWEGVYNHFDSYPTWLGIEVYNHLKDLIAKNFDLNEFAKNLLYSGDWRNYLGGCKCEYCGQERVGQPHTISGVLSLNTEFKTKRAMYKYYSSLPAWKDREEEIENMIKTEWELRENIKRTGYIDPECKHHQHEELESTMTSKTADPLFIEWVYVIDIAGKKLQVLAQYKKSKSKRGYGWAEVRVIDLLSESPDFEEIEKSGYKLYEELSKK